jgi:type II secretory pathway pseudopilin PulG
MPELMVAMTILFVVSTFIMSMFVTGMRQTAQATQNQQMETLVREKLSELRVMSYGSLNAELGAHTFAAPNADYQYTVAFWPIDGETMADARVVEVTVTHPEYGTRSARTVRSNFVRNPGRDAWDKFGCGTCHYIPSAGLPDTGLGVQIDLGPIPVNDPSNPRPVPPGPDGVKEYIKNSIMNPTDFLAYDDQGSMQDFYIEGEPNPAPGDPPFDPNSSDVFVADNSMSQAEVDAIANWLSQYQ